MIEKKTLRFMFIGDLVGQPGVALFKKWAPQLKAKFKIDAIIVNGENSSPKGNGIGLQEIKELKESGATVITTGNHAFDEKNVYGAFDERDDFIRPANFPAGCYGKGHALLTVENHTVAVVNLHGRVFSKDLLDCPFKAIDSLLSFLRHKTPIVFVDFHAEATSEKKAMGLFLDGRVSGVYGTHTHVQTADEVILPAGTSYITDLGSSGAQFSVIGFQFDGVIKRMMIHHKFGKFMVEKYGPMVFSGIWVEVDVQTGKALKIERISVTDTEICQTFTTDDKNAKK
ncbi:MAG: TIGR00282 family metallophosphoesterase [bacterium]